MKKARYSDEQIVRILREADQGPIDEVSKRHGVSEASIYAWLKRFLGMGAQFATTRGVGQRRACALTCISRSSLYDRHTLSTKDEAVITAMKKLSSKHPRYGSRRIRVLLRRQGLAIGKTRCRRLWAKSGLQVPQKKRRKMSSSELRISRANETNAVWSYDFVHDMCANGQKLKCLTVVEEYTR
jgi:putative transposase